VSSDVMDVQILDVELVLRLSDGSHRFGTSGLVSTPFTRNTGSSATIGGSSAKALASTGRIWMKISPYAVYWLRLDGFLCFGKVTLP
jgi:hypothetical protein